MHYRLQQGVVPEDAYMQMLQTNTLNIQSPNPGLPENELTPPVANV